MAIAVALLVVGFILAAVGIANARASGGLCGLPLLAGVTIGTGILALIYAVVRGRMRV